LGRTAECGAKEGPAAKPPELPANRQHAKTSQRCPPIGTLLALIIPRRGA
jgi:hypothetical protein